jgi:hypothetical protein
MLMGGFACGRFPFKGCLFQTRRVTADRARLRRPSARARPPRA